MENEKKQPSFLRNCLGCLGIAVVCFIVLMVILCGGSYWFIKNKALQEQPIQVESEQLPEKDLRALENKLQAYQASAATTNRMEFNANELTYLINKELRKAKEEAITYKGDKKMFDIVAVDVGLLNEEMNVKMSMQFNKRYLNMEALGKPHIVANLLTFDLRKLKLGKMEFNYGTFNRSMNRQINQLLETKLNELQYQKYRGNFQDISIKDGKLTVVMKKNSF